MTGLMDNMGGLLGTIIVGGVAMKMTDYMFQQNKKRSKKKLKSIWG